MRHPPQEPDVLPGRALSAVGLGVILSLGFGILIAFFIGRCRSRELGREWVPPMASPAITGAVNGMENKPFTVEALGLEEHAREEGRLARYGWVDREHQIVHVPINVAIEIYLAKHRGGAR